MGFATAILRERGLIMLLTAVLFAAGLYALAQLNIEAYPDPAPPMVEIITQRAGWSAEEIEQQITVPLETQLNGMPGLEHMRSTSLFGLSDIKCYFAYSSSYLQDRQEVLNRVGMTELPAGVKPELSPTSTIGELYRYQLTSDRHTLMELKEINDWVVRRQFKQVAGVIDVVSFGGPTKEFHVDLDPYKLVNYHVSVSDVMEALEKSNSNVGANYIDIGPQSYNVRGVGLYGSLTDIENVMVAQKDGVPVFVKQLGNVYLGRAVPLGRVGKDHEQDIVNGVILMRPGGQSLPTLKGVTAKVEELNTSGILPKGVKLVSYADRTKLINITTGTVQHTLISGMVLVVLVLLAFLGDLRASLIVAVCIPLSLCVVFLVMVLMGQSANLISMGAIDFGIIVDAAVIVVENIHRHLSHRDPASEGMEPIVAGAVAEVLSPTFFSTIVIFISFLPLFTMQGVEGKIFGPMATTYAMALGGALLLGLTFCPVACCFFLKKGGHDETFLVRAARRPYNFLLGFCVRHPKLTLAGATVVLLITLGAGTFLGGEFMPKLEEGNLYVRTTMPTGISYHDATKIANEARDLFRTFPQVITVVSQLGRPDDGTDPITFANCEFYVPLTPKDTWPAGLTKAGLIDQMDKKFRAAFPGVDFNFSQAIEDNVKEAMSGVKGENSLKLVGRDLNELEKVATQIMDQMRTVEGVRDLGVLHLLGQPNLVIKTSREAAARYDISAGDVNNAVSAAVGGASATEVLEGDRRFDLSVRFQSPYRESPEAIGRIPIVGKDGASVPLSQLADIKYQSGAAYIYHEDNLRFIPIKFSVRGRDLTSTVAEIQDKITKNVKFPEGYVYVISGEFEQFQGAINRLKVVVPLTLVLIFLLLARTFASTRDATIVMSTVPFATIGGIWALLATRNTFSISAAVGFISLFGVCILQGVLLVSRIKTNLAEGMDPTEAVISGGKLLLRPVLMVATGAAIGLLPAAMARGIGSETQRPLATVVVGGMASSVFVILLLLPAVYRLFLKKGSRLEPARDPEA